MKQRESGKVELRAEQLASRFCPINVGFFSNFSHTITMPAKTASQKPVNYYLSYMQYAHTRTHTHTKILLTFLKHCQQQ